MSKGSATLDRTVGAIVFDGDRVLSAGRAALRRLGPRLERLSLLGVHVAVLGVADCGHVDAVLGVRPHGPGRLFLVGDAAVGVFEIQTNGPVPMNLPDGREMWDVLADLGVSGELVLVVDELSGDVMPSPGERKPVRLVDLMDEQLRRAARQRVPEICRDPGWNIVECGVDEGRHRTTEALFTTFSGGVGMRGSVEENPDFGRPLIVANGVYSGTGDADGLLPGPDVLDVRIQPPVRDDVRILDLRSGVLYREEVGARDVAMRSMRFGSVVEPGVFAVRAEARVGRLHMPRTSVETGWWDEVTGNIGSIGATVDQSQRLDSGVRTIQQLIAVDAASSTSVGSARATRRLGRARSRGIDQLLSQQREGWAARWRQVGVDIPSDPQCELGLRFALYQLWGVASARDEVAVGARGLTGSGYSGHVFWDADVFVLPALVTIAPTAAAGMVDYRLRRLRAAQDNAREHARCGARFPWESALDGHDVTPESGWVGGEQVPILTGAKEEHITADVAWAVMHLAQWTRVDGAPSMSEARLLRETARYWAARIRVDRDGRGHIDDVIGPDEYHESVDDNAFTNVMARWNLRTAAKWAVASKDERESWCRIAECIVDGYDPDTGIYEQFGGYLDREPLLIRDFCEPPVAADVLLGRKRVTGSQLIKQSDVLMMHHLVPGELVPDSLGPNLDHYVPRTAHGSSLSPAITAAVLARGNRPDEALDLLRVSLRIDLDDLGDTTAAGVHIGACGGAWQAIVTGFLGAYVDHGILELDPVLPTAWPTLEVRFQCLGRDVRVQVVEGVVTVSASGHLRVRVNTSRGLRAHSGPNVQVEERRT